MPAIDMSNRNKCCIEIFVPPQLYTLHSLSNRNKCCIEIAFAKEAIFGLIMRRTETSVVLKLIKNNCFGLLPYHFMCRNMIQAVCVYDETIDGKMIRLYLLGHRNDKIL